MTRVKLNALTGLRIVAAGMIVVHHSRALQIPVPNYSLDHGVSFFFVLSGFIIAYAYPSLDSKGDVLRFFAARFARIWPAHIVALLLVLVCLQQPLDKTIVANAFLVHGWIPSWPWYFSYNAPSWSISTECFFYVAFVPLIFRWTASWWWKWIGSLVLVFVLIKIGVLLNLPALSKNDEPTLHGLLYVSPLARLFEFTTGMVVCLAFRNIEPMSRAINRHVFGVLELMVVAVAGFSIVTNAPTIILAPYFGSAGIQWLGHTSDVLVWPFLIFIFAFERGWLSRLLGSRPMVLLGEISFSVYLVHLTVFYFYLRHFQLEAGKPAYFGLAICIGVTLALAFAIWAIIEVPCRSAARRWLKVERKAFVPATSISQQET